MSNDVMKLAPVAYVPRAIADGEYWLKGELRILEASETPFTCVEGWECASLFDQAALEAAALRSQPPAPSEGGELPGLLTDDEILRISGQVEGGSRINPLISFARAIEQTVLAQHAGEVERLRQSWRTAIKVAREGADTLDRIAAERDQLRAQLAEHETVKCGMCYDTGTIEFDDDTSCPCYVCAGRIAEHKASAGGVRWKVGDCVRTAFGVGTISRISRGTGFTEYFFDNLTLPDGRHCVSEKDVIALAHPPASAGGVTAAEVFAAYDELNAACQEEGWPKNGGYVDRSPEGNARRHAAGRKLRELRDRVEAEPPASAGGVTVTGWQQGAPTFHASAGGVAVAYRVVRDDGRAMTDWIDGDGTAEKSALRGGRIQVAYAEPGGVAVPETFKNAVAKLVFMARTSGGTAGRDQALCDACAIVEFYLSLPKPLAAAPQPSAPQAPGEDGGDPLATWRSMDGVKCSGCGKVLSQHINQLYCHAAQQEPRNG